MKSLILPALLLAGCAVPTVDLPFDSDRDGLLDDEETRYGTDPANAHSDDDGWVDGDEVASFTDPLDPEDHPYTGGWPIGACRHSLDGSGWNVGFTVHNTNNLDQNGDLVKLHDFCEVPYLLTYYTPT
jgi:hypothetical protein